MILQTSDSICDTPKAFLSDICIPLVPHYEVHSCILLGLLLLQWSCTADGFDLLNLGIQFLLFQHTPTTSVNLSEWNLTDSSLFLQFTKCINAEKFPRHKAPALCQKVTLIRVISVKQNTRLWPAEIYVYPGVLFEPFHFSNQTCFWKIGSS